MTDTLTPTQRSERMSRVRSKDTKPEMTVRRLAHGMGYRYRLHRKNLPGKPDLTFPSRRKVIFVHGCFWHRHPSATCKLARLPKSRLDFWLPKFEKNTVRDARNLREILDMGWSSLVVWECETENIETLRERLRAFLEGET